MVSTQFKFTPIGDCLLVKALVEDENKTASGIFLGTTHEETVMKGAVEEAGEGRLHDGKLQPMRVKKGNTVVFSNFSASNVMFINGSRYYILNETDILGILS